MADIASIPAAVPTRASSTSLGPNVNALFDALLEFQWRSIGFPVVDFDTELRQDLVVHKFVDRDGAYIEGMGRHPIQISARIPFLNGLTKGTQESWSSGKLYPTSWRAFFQACADRTSGILQHPELGKLNCKCESARTSWDGNVRSGVYVHATWIESDDTGVDLQTALSTASPLAKIKASAVDLDAQVASIDPSRVPQLPPLQFSYTQLANMVASVFDAATLAQKELGGRMDNILYQASVLEASFGQAANRDVFNWPMYQASERLKEAAYEAKKALLARGRPIGTYTVQKPSTLGQLSAQLGADIQDIMQLNIAYVGIAVVPRGAAIRYYLKAA